MSRDLGIKRALPEALALYCHAAVFDGTPQKAKPAGVIGGLWGVVLWVHASLVD